MAKSVIENARAGRLDARLALLVAIALIAGGIGFWSARRGSQGAAPAVAGRATESSAGPSWFADVTATSGVTFRHVAALQSRMRFPEIMCGGVAVFDYDGDGDLDLYFVQGGDLDATLPERPGNQLFQNLGAGRFSDVTGAAGVGDRGYGNGACVGDYDGDGDIDLYVTNVGPDVFYLNQGNGTFADVTRSVGLGDPGWSTSAALFDSDRDGDLDLFVGRYVEWRLDADRPCYDPAGNVDYCSPLSYRPSPDLFYRNRGDGTFENVSEKAGLLQAFGNALGVAVADFDANGWLDVYVANDGMPNQLWSNDGSGTFTDVAPQLGAAVDLQGASEAGMGVIAFDAEYDGDVDIFLTHLGGETNTCYLNQGSHFSDDTQTMGLAWPSLPFTGFGVAAADLDHDGWQEIYVANGRVTRPQGDLPQGDVYAELDQLYRGVAAGRWEEVEPRGGMPGAAARTSRGLAAGDFDDDGDVDLVIVDRNEAPRLLANVAPKQGAWIGFDVRDQRGVTAIGARVRVRAGDLTMARVVASASSYQSACDPRVHFGLGRAATIDEILVIWPDLAAESFGARAPNAVHTLRRGAGQPSSAPR